MKHLGIVRNLDPLNRLVVPKELVRTMQLEGAAMEIFVEGDSIVLKKYTPGCTFCKSMDGLMEFGGQQICEHCREKIRQSFKK